MKALYIRQKVVIALVSLVALVGLITLMARYPASWFAETEDNIDTQHINISTKQTNLPAGTQVGRISGIIEGYSVTEMMNRSTLIVYGSVDEIFDSIAIEGVSGGMMIMTDILIKPLEIFRGEAESEIVVRLEGGYISNRYDDYDEVPEFRKDEKWLLFLYQPNTGGGCNAEGDYYYLVGLFQGAYKQLGLPDGTDEKAAFEVGEITFANAKKLEIAEGDETKIARSLQPFGKASQKMNPLETMFTASALREEMPMFNKEHPIDPDLVRRETLEAYDSNLKNGMCTQEEYDRWVSDLDKYARVLTEEDYIELENEEIDPELQAEIDKINRQLEEEAKDIEM